MIDLLLFMLLPFLLIAWFAGQGWLIMKLSGHLHEPVSTYKTFARLSAAVITIGMSINYLLVLIIRDIRISLIAGTVASVAGWILFLIFDRSKLFAKHLLRPVPWARSAVLFLTTLVLFIPILSLPLSDWDARSIWFFHGKMIYYAGTLGPEAGWLFKTVQFSHVDYPKLVPAMAAQITTVAGYWNEYLPKAVLTVLLFPALLQLSALVKRNLQSVFLMLMLVFIVDDELWNGYMDGYLAVFTGLAILSLAAFIKSKRRLDLVGLIAYLGILPALKNEGILMGLILTIALLWALLVSRERTEIQKKEWLSSTLLFSLVAALPTLLWQLLRLQWGLRNDLGIGTSASKAQLMTRLTDGSGWTIFRSIMPEIDVALFGLVLLLLFAAYSRRPLSSVTWSAMIVGLVYLAGMVAIYLMTPHDLDWHLGSSVNRTMFTVNTCFFMAAWLLMEDLDDGGCHTARVSLT